MLSKAQLQRAIFINLGNAVLSVVLASVVVWVASGNVVKIANSLVQQKTSALFLQTRIGDISTLRAGLATIHGNTEKLHTAFPPSDDISSFLAVLNSTASASGVQQSVTASTPAPTGISNEDLTLSTIDYAIATNGTLTTFLKYLDAFEHLPYFTTITSISLSAPGATGWQGNSSIQMQARLWARATN